MALEQVRFEVRRQVITAASEDETFSGRGQWVAAQAISKVLDRGCNR